ncbi:MAG: hypothetical protein WB681_06565 [Candidatus Cybelea sp.]
MALSAVQESPVNRSLSRVSEDELRSIAELVVGEFPDAPRARGTYGIAKLMTRCGVQAEYDGSPKPDWVVKILQGADANFLGKLLLRLTSADEYLGDQASAQRAVSFLNKLLLSRGVQILFENGASSLAEVDPNLTISEATARTGIDSGLIVPDFEQLDSFRR